MEAIVFNNEIFDSWLNKKSDEILSKVDREKISTEEMIVLVLKAQTNHFHHMDVDMKKGLSNIDHKFTKKFEQVDQRLEKMDQRMDSRFMWMIGITVAMSGGIYLKLFLG
jgi:amino acid permease